MVENIDDNLGRLMAKMDEWDLWKDTVFIFMSDNGMAGKIGTEDKVLGKDKDGNELKGYNAGMKGYKGSPDEGGVRVPFFIRWEGHTVAGKQVEEVAAHIDLLPTLAGIAGVDFPKEQVEGRDILPLIEGKGGDWSDRLLFTHTGRWPTGADPDEFQWRGFAVRNAQYRMVGRDELYDMEADPGQKANVIGEHADVAKMMTEAYEKFWEETRSLMVNEKVPMSKVRPYHVAYKAQMEAGGIPDDE